MKRNIIQRILIFLGKTFNLGKLVDLKKVRIKNDNYLRKYKYEDSKYVGTFFVNFGFHEVVTKDYFGNGSVVEFEGKKYSAPEKVDIYLTHMYGDYMKLPPEDKRVGHHIIKIDKTK